MIRDLILFNKNFFICKADNFVNISKTIPMPKGASKVSISELKYLDYEVFSFDLYGY